MESFERGMSNRQGLGRRPFLGAALLLCSGFVDRCRARPVAGGITMDARESTVRPMITRDGIGFGLALGAGRLAQVVAEGLRVLAVDTGAVQVMVPSKRIIACGVLREGSVLAIERSDTETAAIQVRPKGEVVRYPMRHLVFGGNRQLLADPSTAQQFYLLDPERRHVEMYELRLVAGFLRFRKRIELSASTNSDVVAMGDGSLICPDGSELQQLGPVPAEGELSRRSLAWTLPQATLLAAGPSGDTLWAASPQGEVSLVQVPRDGAAQVVRTFKVPGPVFQLAAARGSVAVLQFEQSARGDAVKWTLLITDEHGKPRYSISLPAEPPVVPLATAPHNRCLRVSSEHVAVGGPEEVNVWELAGGRRLYPGSPS